MLPGLEPLRELTGPDQLSDELLRSTEPVVLRGLVSDWPAVRAARSSPQRADAYLRSHYQDATVGAMLGAPETEGRFFYNEDMSGFNFQPVKAKLTQVLDELERHAASEHPPAVYVGSTTIDTCLPGFRAENDLELGGRDALASIWIGNRTRIAAHYDVPDNIACVVAGRRRFILFPPEQLENLYVGPLDFTPAGQAISLVDFANPDYERHPRFAEALQHGLTAELGPGDAIFIPSMWWHHIEALESFNILVNYWWSQVPPYLDTPTNALMLGILSMRALPPAQRRAWKEMFRHYIFDADDDTAGALGPLDENGARKLRAHILKKMNR